MDTLQQIKQLEQKIDIIQALLTAVQKLQSKAMLDTDEAASYLGVSLSTLYKHTSAGNIAYYKPNGKLILFNKDDLDRWLQSKRIPSNNEITNLI